MTARTSRPPLQSRYTMERIIFEIREQIRLRGRGSQREIALAIGVSEQAFSHKMKGTYSSFSIDEIGRIAEHWDAPLGWPWIPWEAGDLVRHLLGLDPAHLAAAPEERRPVKPSRGRAP